MAAASASFSATHTISVPGSTLQEFGTVRLAPTGIVIPRDMWVRVRVSGSVRIDADPEWVRRFCNPGPPSECPPPYDGASAGPLGVDAGLEVQVAMNNAYFLWRPRTSGGDGAEDIMWVSAGTSVLAGRAGLWEFGDCWGCTHQPGRAGRYRLTGSQTLTVEEINPLSVRADRTETDPAEPVGFTARADEEIRNLEWAFIAGDTLPESGPAAARAPAGGASFSTSAAPAADWNALASCRRKEACTTRVAASGRMWVRGHIEDQIVFAKSEIVRVQPVRLKLDCTPNPVTRGQSITCTASKDPSSAPGELKITGWSFEGKARTDGDVTSRTWAGIMVRSGTVTVRATIGTGAEETAAAVVTVEARPWKDPLLPSAIERFVGCADPLPQDCPLRYPPVYYRDIGQMHAIPEVGFTRFHLNSGPNEGYNFVGGDEFFLSYPRVTIYLNEVLRSPHDGYFRDRRVKARRQCVPAEWLEEVRGHELTHYRLLKEGLAQGQLAARWESNLFYGSIAEAQVHYRDQWRETAQELRDYGDFGHFDASQFPAQDADCYEGLLRNPPPPPS